MSAYIKPANKNLTDSLTDSLTDKNLVQSKLPVQSVIGFPVTALPFHGQMQTILDWAGQGLSRMVCVANVHMLIEASYNNAFASVLRQADLVTPDGMPLVWMMRLLGTRKQDRVAGMDIFLSLCKEAPDRNISIFLLGSQESILERMQQRLQQEFPNLKVAGAEPLPFGQLTSEDNQKAIDTIHASGASLVFLSLGCPKQEAWMAEHQGSLNAVMIGVGGVFPVYAGIHTRAPGWIRELGFEWLYRLMQEPRRLWKRYAETIPPFIWLALKQLLDTYSRSLRLS
ncbi:MAG: WecB/TagA/CpsF family glycosyltransferase [Leptolyngbyaceae cyanobacterium bins.59]|nr:WecB/TagA/CpsF family glycosyltransferase [Leptolyngbyaceae cyanobacterium bins.59]